MHVTSNTLGEGYRFVDTGWANEKVLEFTSAVAEKTIQKYTESWMSAQYRLLGHLLRADYND